MSWTKNYKHLIDFRIEQSGLCCHLLLGWGFRLVADLIKNQPCPNWLSQHSLQQEHKHIQ